MYTITQKQYNYLLPVFGAVGSNKMLQKTIKGRDFYFFIGTDEEYKDMLNRCKYLNN